LMDSAARAEPLHAARQPITNKAKQEKRRMWIS
jgi:hypothetical protein